MTILLSLYHTTQLLVSTYSAFLSWISIRKVQTYESATQRLAKYSKTVDNELQRTQTTEAAGAVACFASFVSSVYLLVSPASPPTSSLLSFGLAVAIKAAHSHISNYWREKSKVPLPKSADYNDAVTATNKLGQVLGGLAASWAVAGVWYLVGWVSS